MDRVKRAYFFSAVACAAAAPVCALAETSGHVRVVNLRTRKLISRFDTDLMGNRLALSQDGKVCFVGGDWGKFRSPWTDKGLIAYSTKSGAVLWQRRDLHRIQYVTVNPRRKEISVLCDSRSSSLVHPKTGEVLYALPGIERYWHSALGDYAIARPGARLLRHSTGKTIAHLVVDGTPSYQMIAFLKIDPTTWPSTPVFASVLDATFSSTHAFVSEESGPLHCFSLRNGDHIWQTSRDRVHFGQLFYNTRKRLLCAIRGVGDRRGWNIETIDPKTGTGVSSIAPEPWLSATCCYSPPTGLLVSNDGRVYSVDGKWKRLLI